MQEKTLPVANIKALFLTFFKVGFFTFGGGYAMLPVFKREIVDFRGWMTERDFLETLIIAQSIPGAVAVNSAIYTGYRLRGFKGAFVTTLGIVIPSFFTILILAHFFTHAAGHPVTIAAFAGIRPAVAALIAAAVVSVGRPVLKNRQKLIIMLALLALNQLAGFHPVLILAGGSLSGVVGHFLDERKKGEVK